MLLGLLARLLLGLWLLGLGERKEGHSKIGIVYKYMTLYMFYSFVLWTQ